MYFPVKMPPLNGDPVIIPISKIFKRKHVQYDDILQSFTIEIYYNQQISV